MSTVQVKTAKGFKEVEGEERPSGLTVNRQVAEDGWAVTHTASGLRLCHATDVDDARSKAEKLEASGADWHQHPSTLMRDGKAAVAVSNLRR